jgi:hypothetical protein
MATDACLIAPSRTRLVSPRTAVTIATLVVVGILAYVLFR